MTGGRRRMGKSTRQLRRQDKRQVTTEKRGVSVSGNVLPGMGTHLERSNDDAGARWPFESGSARVRRRAARMIR